MYNVLLVDDDVAVLEFLRTMIPWDHYRFRLAGSCTNAYDALQQCREEMPDLVVTDIGMPGMDGIELINSVKEMSQRPRFVILSCHDEFRYAQQAVQMGVHDYILKETLDTATIVKLLSSIKAKMEADDELHHEVQRLQFQAKRSKSPLKEKWLRDLLSTPISEDPLWKDQLKEFGLHPVWPYFIPVIGRLHRVREASIRYEAEDTLKFIVENAVEELLEHEPDTLLFSYSAKEFCILFNCRNELKVNPYARIETICREVQRKLAQVLKLPFSIIAGEMESERSGIKRQFSILTQQADQLFYAAEPKYIKPMAGTNFPLCAQDEDLLRPYFEFADKMNRYMLEGNSDETAIVDPFIDFITARRLAPKSVKQIVFKLVLDMMMKLKFNQQYTNEKLLNELEQLGNVEELREWLIDFVREASLLMEKISKQSKKVEIIDAQKYVQLHVNEKISLEEVADHLHLNASYFSRLFKKETGENFIEYVKRIKMEKAKELLSDSGKTVETVSQMLGYENKSYFVKLFKQHYGIIPSRFV